MTSGGRGKGARTVEPSPLGSRGAEWVVKTSPLGERGW